MDLMPYSGLHWSQTNTWYIYILADQTPIHKIKEINLKKNLKRIKMETTYIMDILDKGVTSAPHKIKLHSVHFITLIWAVCHDSWFKFINCLFVICCFIILRLLLIISNYNPKIKKHRKNKSIIIIKHSYNFMYFLFPYIFK